MNFTKACKYLSRLTGNISRSIPLSFRGTSYHYGSFIKCLATHDNENDFLWNDDFCLSLSCLWHFELYKGEGVCTWPHLEMKSVLLGNDDLISIALFNIALEEGGGLCAHLNVRTYHYPPCCLSPSDIISPAIS